MSQPTPTVAAPHRAAMSQPTQRRLAAARRRAAALSLLLAPFPLLALTLEWDYEDDSRVTEFRLYQDQTQHYVISDPTARTVDGATAGILGGHTYTLRACAPNACSEPSNSLYLPASPASIRIIIEW